MAAVLKSLRRLKSYFFSSFDSKDPDLEWKQQAEAVERNPMYKLVHLGGRGFLIDEYSKRESDAQFLQLLENTVRPFLYPNGEGMIREIDYARYRRRLTVGSEVCTVLNRQLQIDLSAVMKYCHDNTFDQSKTLCLSLNSVHTTGFHLSLETIITCYYIGLCKRSKNYFVMNNYTKRMYGPISFNILMVPEA